jgi:hypothetical protein
MKKVQKDKFEKTGSEGYLYHPIVVSFFNQFGSVKFLKLASA